MPLQSHPFDDAAEGYDRSFTDTWIGREFRAAVWRSIEPLFGSGDRVLELGCGTGEDTVWLARRGVRIVATDASRSMLEKTRAKIAAACVEPLVETRMVDLARIEQDSADLRGPFDGVLSNFGPLNCVADRRPVAQALASLVRPGGRAVVVVMGRCCPWEIGWHLIHGQPRTAFRRFRSGATARVGEQASLAVWYPSPRRVSREFAPLFRRRGLAAIGCFLPPPYLDHLATAHPRLIRRLAGVERRWCGSFPFTWLGDHFLLSLERSA